MREGKTEAWRTLYEAYAGRVWLAVARRMGPESADVADVVQEIFLAAARSASTYDAARGSLWGWLSGIARRHVALHYRRQTRHHRLRRLVGQPGVDNQRVVRWLEGREDLPADALATAELADSVRTTLGQLPADYSIQGRVAPRWAGLLLVTIEVFLQESTASWSLYSPV